MTVEIHRAVELEALPDNRIHELFGAAERVVELPDNLVYSVALVDDETIQTVNATYREKNAPTDVLSFRYDDTAAEIIISADRVRAQASEYGNTLEQESAWMVVHGILHTIGWDHERSEQEARAQRALEVKILGLCGLESAR